MVLDNNWIPIYPHVSYLLSIFGWLSHEMFFNPGYMTGKPLSHQKKRFSHWYSDLMQPGVYDKQATINDQDSHAAIWISCNLGYIQASHIMIISHALSDLYATQGIQRASHYCDQISTAIKSLCDPEYMTGKPLHEQDSHATIRSLVTWNIWQLSYDELLAILKQHSSFSPDYIHSLPHYHHHIQCHHPLSESCHCPKIVPLLMAFSINITMLYKEIRDIIREQWLSIWSISTSFIIFKVFIYAD